MEPSPEQQHKLVGAFRRALLTAEGEIILEHLRWYCEMDEQAGAELTHSECAYRNGAQDIYRYIDGLVADDT